MPHKKILLELRAFGLTVKQISDYLKVKPLQVYRYNKADKIPPKRLYQLTELQKQITENKSKIEKISTEKLLTELTRRGLQVKID